MNLIEAKKNNFEMFFSYLEQHLSENGGKGSPLFQPLSRKDSCLSSKIRAKFEAGCDVAFTANHWRKLWLAINPEGQVCGHIDLRHHASPYANHRVLLGMGVDRKYRRRGIGNMLLQVAERFCFSNSEIQWIDLNVLSSNTAAIQLYTKSGFYRVGEIEDLYRIDGQSVSDMWMVKPVGQYPRTTDS